MIRRTRLFARTAKALLSGVLAVVSGAAMADPFTSPSGNILCYVESRDWQSGAALPPAKHQLICLIFAANWGLPRRYDGGETSCDLDSTRATILRPRGSGRVTWFCHGDVFWPLPAPTQAYGTTWREGAFSCQVTRKGVRCGNGAGGEVFLSRAKMHVR